MSVLSEKAEKGNIKALENIYLNGRGLVGWIWAMLSGEKITVENERKIWKAFYDAVNRGDLAAGDQLEPVLAAAAAAVCSGNDPVFHGKGEGNPAISLIKFPGDLDAGKKYMEDLVSALDPGIRTSAIVSACGFSAEEAGRMLGLSAEKVSSGLSSSAATIKDRARELAAGRYNINIPTLEMFADILGRVTAVPAGDPDGEILEYARGSASAKSSEPKKKTEKKTGIRRYLMLAAAACCILAIGLSMSGVFRKGSNPDDQHGGTGTYDGPVDVDPETDERVYANYKVVMVVRDYGTIELELDSSAAPRTVKNFVDLANQKFYDGLTFHRIMEGFMIQGGDPEGNGSGGSKKKIIGEFEANGVENPISHKRGVISMARASNDYNSARSQFFIVQQDSPHLDGQYAAFGHVTSGMDVVDRIAADAEPIDNNGTIPADKQPVIESVTVTKTDK